jgi:hypothetical protein
LEACFDDEKNSIGPNRQRNQTSRPSTRKAFTPALPNALQSRVYVAAQCNPFPSPDGAIAITVLHESAADKPSRRLRR